MNYRYIEINHQYRVILSRAGARKTRKTNPKKKHLKCYSSGIIMNVKLYGKTMKHAVLVKDESIQMPEKHTSTP